MTRITRLVTRRRKETFPFMSLPAELRNEVYSRYRFTNRIDARNNSQLGWEPIYRLSNRVAEILKLGQVSRQLRQEFFHHCATTTELVVCALSLESFVAVMPAAFTTGVRRMTLTPFLTRFREQNRERNFGRHGRIFSKRCRNRPNWKFRVWV